MNWGLFVSPDTLLKSHSKGSVKCWKTSIMKTNGLSHMSSTKTYALPRVLFTIAYFSNNERRVDGLMSKMQQIFDGSQQCFDTMYTDS